MTQGEKRKATVLRPDIEQLTERVFNGVAEITGVCRVEADGYCEHGHASWLLVLGMTEQEEFNEALNKSD